MAFPVSTSSAMLSLKVALISTAVLSLAVVLKLSVPVVTDFAVTELPLIYTSAISWLRPPYLYLLINCIIISIVASAKLQKQDQPIISPPAPVVLVVAEEAAEERVDANCVGNDYVNGVVVEDFTVEKEIVMDDGNDEFARLVKAPQRSDSMEFLDEIEKSEDKEKPLVSARLGRRKSIKASAEVGKGAAALGVSRSKRHDTLETTWKMITDGRPMPLTRHLKKSDTWESHVHRDTNPSSEPPSLPTKMKKSETFSDNKSSKPSLTRQESAKLKREPSPSQDELNKRVEAFIKKFNEEMRLQRQESLNKYKEMAAHGG